jgi:hypothetical protein
MRLQTTGAGYEQVFCDGKTVEHHRLLAFAWGDLDSPFYPTDDREVHHETPIGWMNLESNIRALTPREHMELDPDRRGFWKP